MEKIFRVIHRTTLIRNSIIVNFIFKIKTTKLCHCHVQTGESIDSLNLYWNPLDTDIFIPSRVFKDFEYDFY